MKIWNPLIRILLTAIAILLLANILKGISIDNYLGALYAAIVLEILRLVLKPLLVTITLPLNVATLGLFTTVINVAIILIADYFLKGFYVKNFWWALGFSFLLSSLQSILYSIFKKEDT